MKISVCMATYNGAVYIEQQMRSILKQLRENDEVIVLDDASSDDTIKIIEALNDSRVKLERNKSNAGVLKTFENAIRKASGELIFLSDQDDLWLDGKVDAILEVFGKFPDVTLVFTNAELINSKGESLGRQRWRGKVSIGLIGNLVSNRFLGCTLAFRKTLRDCALPFPEDIPMHDMWLGLISAMYGKNHYMGNPLIAYRVHEKSVTYKTNSFWSRLAFIKKAKWRFQLVKNLFKRRRELRRQSPQSESSI